VALYATGVQGKPLAITMFCCAAFVLGSVGQEFFRGTRARRAMAGEPAPVALLALVRRNRRRYGGYVVHVGMAVLFIGVAASSSFGSSLSRPRPAVGQPLRGWRMAGPGPPCALCPPALQAFLCARSPRRPPPSTPSKVRTPRPLPPTPPPIRKTTAQNTKTTK